VTSQIRFTAVQHPEVPGRIGRHATDGDESGVDLEERQGFDLDHLGVFFRSRASSSENQCETKSALHAQHVGLSSTQLERSKGSVETFQVRTMSLIHQESMGRNDEKPGGSTQQESFDVGLCCCGQDVDG